MSNQQIPKTIQALIESAEAIGGKAILVKDRRWDFSLPCRMTGGAIRMVVRGSVGYYVREDGKNIIGGASAMRKEIAYWGQQSS